MDTGYWIRIPLVQLSSLDPRNELGKGEGEMVSLFRNVVPRLKRGGRFFGARTRRGNSPHRHLPVPKLSAISREVDHPSSR